MASITCCLFCDQVGLSLSGFLTPDNKHLQTNTTSSAGSISAVEMVVQHARERAGLFAVDSRLHYSTQHSKTWNAREYICSIGYECKISRHLCDIDFLYFLAKYLYIFQTTIERDAIVRLTCVIYTFTWRSFV